MKKNQMMRLASVLLVAVLLSTCAISGTFAKYVTSGSAADEARVAKWGVTLKATNADALFAKEYKNSSSVMTVSSTDDVIAPGTNGSFGGFTVTGTPEVSTAVSYAATVTLTGNWEDEDGDFYFPLTIKVGEIDVDLSSANTAEAVASAIEAAIEKVSATYTPGQTVAAGVAFTWTWAIGDASEADTQLGNIAAGIVDNKTAPNISISVSATITQVD